MTRISILPGSPPILYVDNGAKRAKQHIIIIHTGAEIHYLLRCKALCGTRPAGETWSINNGPNTPAEVCKNCLRHYSE